MGRKLREIEVDEISFVDAPSTRKKFLIIKGDEGVQKQKAKIQIDSNGTVKGTKITVNGEEVEDLVDFCFSFYQPRSGDVGESGKNVSCTYSKVTETEDGFKHTDHFYLSKSLEVNKGMKELKELLKDYLGEDFSEDEFEKAEKLSDKAVAALKEALTTLNKYKGDFPDELKKGVGVLAKYAGYGYPTKKSDEPLTLKQVLETLEKAHVEKAGAKLSKSTREQIQKAIDALKKLLEQDLKKEDGEGGDEEVKKELGEIKKTLEDLAKKTETTKDEDLKKSLEVITKRLEAIEKAKGIKKSIDGDGSGGDKEKWPSFTGLDQE